MTGTTRSVFTLKSVFLSGRKNKIGKHESAEHGDRGLVLRAVGWQLREPDHGPPGAGETAEPETSAG